MANFNFNKIILGGRLCADPVLKTTPTGAQVCTFQIAVNRRFAEKQDGTQTADFFNCTAWRQTAEFVSRYFRKASGICVAGHIETRSWIGQDGQKKYGTEVLVDDAYFVDSKAEMPGMHPAQAASVEGVGYAPTGYTMVPPPAMEPVDDGELPF